MLFRSIREQIQKLTIKESRLSIQDTSSREDSQVELFNAAWEKGLEELDYNKADGIITDEGSIIDIYMNNGDKLTWASKNNPAVAGIYLNGEQIKSVNSQEKFSTKSWDLVKQVYASSSLDKNAGV